MKVSLLINELNIRGGTHKQFLRLCEYLQSENIDFEIITKYYNQELTYPEFSSFKVNYLYSEKKETSLLNKLNIYVKLYKKISQDSNIINIHDNGFLPLIPFLKLINKKIIWQINDLPSYFLEGNSKASNDNFKNKIKRFFAKFTAKYFVNEITVNVTKNKERVLKNLDSESKVFYCGVDVLKDFKIHSYVKKTTINLLTTGVFFSYRNYETGVEVVKQLRDKDFDCRLDIIGDTTWNKEYADKITNMIKTYNLENSVAIHGQVNESKFKSLFDNSDIFLFLNLDQSWGLVVFEAMSVGFPTIVSQSVGAVEILYNEVAIIVDPLDVNAICKQIITITQNETVYNSYAKQAIQHVSEMSWDKMYSKKVLDLYREIDDTNK
jgi:glycosyltransferase involved in cell wall biosynthesis